MNVRRWLIDGLYTVAELACRCRRRDCTAGEFPGDWRPSTLEFLAIRRRILARPSVPTSGFRCPEHNRDSGGSTNSAHKRGALDERATDARERFESVFASFLAYLVCLGLVAEVIAAEWFQTALDEETPDLGIGIARGFVHSDFDDPELTHKRPALWLY